MDETADDSDEEEEEEEEDKEEEDEDEGFGDEGLINQSTLSVSEHFLLSIIHQQIVRMRRMSRRKYVCVV